MFPELKGKILFVFSDPGGAKPLLALAEIYPDSILISDREHSFYKDFHAHVQVVLDSYENIINQHTPDLVVTGTSYRSMIEKKFHRICKEHYISCYAFIDHWTSMLDRFEQPDGSFLFPDKIYVIDERARQLAIMAGIKEDNVQVSGNPYHEWLANWNPPKSKQAFLQDAGIEYDKRNLLLYAPDPLSNINGKEKFGFDEIEVTQQLLEIFATSNLSDWLLLIKIHPNQNIQAILEIIDSKECYLLKNDVDTNSALFHADAVLGFFSNALIEATILNKPVLRYLPIELTNDPIVELNIGVKTNKSQLTEHLRVLKI